VITLENRDQKRGRKKVYLVLLSLLVLVIFLLIVYVLSISQYSKQSTIYFQETFDHPLEIDWKLVDANIQKEGDEKSGIAILNRNQYIAPHLEKDYSKEESPPKSFVWNFTVKISDFTDDSVMLGLLEFPSNDLAIITNRKGQIGITRNLFDEALYSSNLAPTISLSSWHNITVLFNVDQNELTVYLDAQKVLETALTEETFPIRSVWLGAVWIGGKESLGVPLGVAYDNMLIANDAFMPKPNIFLFYRNLFFDLFLK
jgi:hypothetical protein